MKFSIRDILWLTALVAIGAGWWFDRGQWSSRCATLEQSNKALEDRYRQAVAGFDDAVRMLQQGHH